MKLAGFISLFVTLALALSIALLSPLELISDGVFKGILAALIGSAVLSETIQRKEYRADIEKLLENQLEDYGLEIRGVLDAIIPTNQILKFNSSQESYEYLTQKIYETETRILDVTMGPNIYPKPADIPEYRRDFAQAKREILQRNEINYNHIAIVNNVSRLKRIKEELSYSKNYLVGILKSTDEIPKISFFVIDNKEVIIGGLKMYDPASVAQDIAISNPQVVELFVQYFNLLWPKCEIIKDDETRVQILGELNRKLGNN